MNKCKCGCGNEVIKVDNDYIQHHHLKKRIPWNKEKTGIYSTESKMKMSRNGKPVSKATRIKIGLAIKNHIVTIETRKKISESIIGDKHHNWKGGCDGWLHNKVWELFGKNKCEICGITNDEYKLKLNRRLSMHCRDSEKYHDLSPSNWMTVCEFGCHQKMDKMDRK